VSPDIVWRLASDEFRLDDIASSLLHAVSQTLDPKETSQDLKIARKNIIEKIKRTPLFQDAIKEELECDPPSERHFSRAYLKGLTDMGPCFGYTYCADLVRGAIRP